MKQRWQQQSAWFWLCLPVAVTSASAAGKVGQPLRQGAAAGSAAVSSVRHMSLEAQNTEQQDSIMPSVQLGEEEEERQQEEASTVTTVSQRGHLKRSAVAAAAAAAAARMPGDPDVFMSSDVRREDDVAARVAEEAKGLRNTGHEGAVDPSHPAASVRAQIGFRAAQSPVPDWKAHPPPRAPPVQQQQQPKPHPSPQQHQQQQVAQEDDFEASTDGRGGRLAQQAEEEVAQQEADHLEIRYRSPSHTPMRLHQAHSRHLARVASIPSINKESPEQSRACGIAAFATKAAVVIAGLFNFALLL